MSHQPQQTKAQKALPFVVCGLLAAGVASTAFISTFARYSSESEGTGTANVAKWAVAAGATCGTTVDITDGSDFAANLTFTPNTSANVVTGKVAPGSTASTTFCIDPTGSEVSVDFTVELDTTDASGIEFNVDSVTATKNDGPTFTPISLTDNGDGTFTGTISLTSNAVLAAADQVLVTATVEWENLDTTPGDTADTDYGINETEIEIPVTIKVSQHI
jgi:hypothetical protein